MKTVSEIAKELGIDVPVMGHKIVGEKMILYLYGGRIVEYPLPKAEGVKENRRAAENAESIKGAEKKLSDNKLQGMTLDGLRKLGASLGIKVHGKGKDELIKAIRNYKEVK